MSFSQSEKNTKFVRMNVSVKELASQLNGEIKGDSDVQINHPAKIEQAEKGAIAFLANMKYEEYLYSTSASAVLIKKDLKLKKEVAPTLILVDEPYAAFVKVLNRFTDSLFQQKGISEQAFIHPEAVIEDDVTICPFVSVGRGAVVKSGSYIMANTVISDFAKIGNDSLLYPNVTVYHYCNIGHHAVIHSGAVIGSDGFGFAPTEEGAYNKVPQVGNVEIGNYVEIGANTTIDRATMGSTVIGNGVKLDNLVQVAHNVVIEDNTVIAAQAGISGSTKIGKNVVVGGQAGFVGHITVANNTKINAQSGVSKSVEEENQQLSGTPAFNWRDELKSQSIFRKLPDLEQRIKDLEQKLNNQ